MSFLTSCGLCCGLLSVWAIIQLTVMGIFYNMESVLLIEDTHAEDYKDYDDFIEQTKKNYRSVAINCWACAGMYVFMLVLSYCCFKSGKAKERKELLSYADEIVYCNRKSKEKKESKQKPGKEGDENKTKKLSPTSSAISL